MTYRWVAMFFRGKFSTRDACILVVTSDAEREDDAMNEISTKIEILDGWWIVRGDAVKPTSLTNIGQNASMVWERP